MQELPLADQRFDGDALGRSGLANLRRNVEAAKREYDLALECVTANRASLNLALDQCTEAHEEYIAARNVLTAAEAVCACGDSRNEGRNPIMCLRSDV
jgi:hypothetical protein